MSQFWENLWTDRRSDGRTDRRTLPAKAGDPKRGQFLYHLFCLKEFFNISVLSQCIVFEYPFKIYKDTFTYQKTLLHTLFCLLLKSLKAFSVNYIYNFVSKKQKVEVTEWSKEIYDNTIWQSYDKKTLKGP